MKEAPVNPKLPEINEEGAKDALLAHVLDKAWEARQKHGPTMDWPAMQNLLADRDFVRHPVTVTFDHDNLSTELFAELVMTGDVPADGYDLRLHPSLRDAPPIWPLCVAYHIVAVNYGEIVSHEEAEQFGATLLGLDQEQYYQELCNLTDALHGLSETSAPSPEPSSSGCCGGGCS